MTGGLPLPKHLRLMATYIVSHNFFTSTHPRSLLHRDTSAPFPAPLVHRMPAVCTVLSRLPRRPSRRVLLPVGVLTPGVDGLYPPRPATRAAFRMGAGAVLRRAHAPS